MTVVGEAGLSSSHPVIAFLAAEGRCRSLSYYKEGLKSFQDSYPFLVGASIKAHRCVCPPRGVILPV